MEIENRTNCIRRMRPGEPIDWEFERWWLLMSPQWPGAIKEMTRHFFELGRLRYEDFQ